MDIRAKIKERVEVLSIEVMRDQAAVDRAQAQVMMKRGALAELQAMLKAWEIPEAIVEQPAKPSKETIKKAKALNISSKRRPKGGR